eukprot:snap_masked-scaffold_7-processed-gene-3.17-mRNA-1 protein AED:1.00 eAED:1.00 QI:0/0/0/0/1/1/2/0/68
MKHLHDSLQSTKNVGVFSLVFKSYLEGLSAFIAEKRALGDVGKKISMVLQYSYFLNDCSKTYSVGFHR